VKDWMAWKWNNSSKAIGPLAFHGICYSGLSYRNGMRVYLIDDKAYELAHELGLFNSIQ